MNRKIKNLVLLFFILLIAACGKASKTENSTLVFKSTNMPALDNLKNEVSVKVSIGEKECNLSLDEDTTLSGSCSNLPLGTHNYKIEYRYTQTNLLLASSSGQLTFEAGKNTEINMDNLVLDYDFDKDGYSNLQEIANNSNPQEKNSTPQEVASIKIDKTTVEVETGKTFQLSLSVLDTLGDDFSGADLVWSSDNDSIATVSNSGLLNAVAQGKVVVTVTDPFTNVSDSFEISIVLEAVVENPVADNQAPSADAGINVQVASGENVSLVGTNSNDADGTINSYIWTSEDESISLNNSDTATASFIAPTVETNSSYNFTLTITDNDGASATDTVTITVLPSASTTLTADAGPDQTAEVGTTITLDGSASQNSNSTETLNYLWTAPDNIMLSDTTVSNPTFTIPNGFSVGTTFTFGLVVSDNNGASSTTDTVEINVKNSNPVANAGDNVSASVGDVVDLDGSGSSDPNNGSLTYSWSSSSGISITDMTAEKTTFTINNGTTAGVQVIDLVVSDNQGGSSSGSIDVIVINSPPAANAGSDQSILLGSIVSINGSASDVNGGPLTYLWSVLNSPDSGFSLSKDQLSFEFIPSVAGDYLLQLEVMDDSGASSVDTVKISVRNLTPPEMVVIPSGTFQMGDQTSSDGILQGSGESDEVPVHTVMIRSFEISKYELTFDEYDEYLKNRESNPIVDPSSITSGEAYDEGWGRGSRPIINVSWNEFQSYLDWLNSQIGVALDDPNRYRLPTEAEWEYAARAGTTTKYSWGDIINRNDANYGTAVCCDGFGLDGFIDNYTYTAPVGQFVPNAYGLYDIHGNVWELTQDCVQDSYADAPNDGSAWLDKNTGDCSRRRARGGAWDFPHDSSRSANRGSINSLSVRLSDVGFRLSRSIELPAPTTKTPEMVSIPGGSFQMGDQTSSDTVTPGAGDSDEVPVHTVSIDPFEMGKYEVTFDEYDEYLKSRTTSPISDPSAINGFGDEAYDYGYGRGLRPVINVTWKDVQAYLDWLNTKLDIALDDPTRYRLPTEAEWEYAARAGTTSLFSTGDCISTSKANFRDLFQLSYTTKDGLSITCPKSDVDLNQTLPVGSFTSNPFGLYDMHGNVYEWVIDCETTDYSNASSNGSDWIPVMEKAKICDYHYVRGGSFGSGAVAARSANRRGVFIRSSFWGFRLARSLPTTTPTINVKEIPIDAGYDYACAIKTDGTLWCWGSEYGIRLAKLSGSSALSPVQVNTDTDWKAVSAGVFHTCAIKADKSLWCWGLNSNGQLGSSVDTVIDVPTKLTSSEWIQITAGDRHNCGIQVDDSLWCWGLNDQGQLGIGNKINQTSPSKVGSQSWLQVSAHDEYTCGIQTDNSLWCWGRNDEGQAGIGSDFTNVSNPTKVNNANWLQVSTGYRHACAIDSSNITWCWGENSDGRLGNNSNNVSFTPVPVSNITNWEWISAGGDAFDLGHSCGITAGQLYCWGSNTHGQLGTSNNNTFNVPASVSTVPVSNTNWIHVSAGRTFSCAYRDDDVINCWGSGGQLGDGIGENSNQPVLVELKL